MKPGLALDLDELLYPFIETLIDFSNERLDKDLTVAEFYTYNFEQIWNCTPDEAVDLVHEFFFQLDQHPDPIEGSVSAVDRLREMFDLYIVTARHHSLEDMTMAWLTQHFPSTFSGVHLCDLYRGKPTPKVDVCVKVGAVALVDDSLGHVAEVAATGRRGILFGDFAWNQAEALPEGVVRVSDWNGVIKNLEDLA